MDGTWVKKQKSWKLHGWIWCICTVHWTWYLANVIFCCFSFVVHRGKERLFWFVWNCIVRDSHARFEERSLQKPADMRSWDTSTIDRWLQTNQNPPELLHFTGKAMDSFKQHHVAPLTHPVKFEARHTYGSGLSRKANETSFNVSLVPKIAQSGRNVKKPIETISLLFFRTYTYIYKIYIIICIMLLAEKTPDFEASFKLRQIASKLKWLAFFLAQVSYSVLINSWTATINSPWTDHQQPVVAWWFQDLAWKIYWSMGCSLFIVRLRPWMN